MRNRTNRQASPNVFALVHESVAEHGIQTSQGKRPLPLNSEKTAPLGLIRMLK